MEPSRRKFIKAFGAGGGLLGVSQDVAAEKSERKGEDYSPGFGLRDFTDPQELADAISTGGFSEHIQHVSFEGEDVQAKVFEEELHGFPLQDGSFIVLSNGKASDARGHPQTDYPSTRFSGEFFRDGNYAPYDRPALDVATLSISFNVPEEVQTLGFEYKFGTIENPEFVDDERFQDFFEAFLELPGGSKVPIQLLPTSERVTVETADEFANSPGGTTDWPEPPLPDPPDVSYNSVTELRPAGVHIEQYQGQTITLKLRIADAGDALLDSAAFIDNLGFDIDLEDAPEPDPIEEIEEMIEEKRDLIDGIRQEAGEVLPEDVASGLARESEELVDTIDEEYEESAEDRREQMREALDRQILSEQVSIESTSQPQGLVAELPEAAISLIPIGRLAKTLKRLFKQKGPLTSFKKVIPDWVLRIFGNLSDYLTDDESDEIDRMIDLWEYYGNFEKFFEEWDILPFGARDYLESIKEEAHAWMSEFVENQRSNFERIGDEIYEHVEGSDTLEEAGDKVLNPGLTTRLRVGDITDSIQTGVSEYQEIIKRSIYGLYMTRTLTPLDGINPRMNYTTGEIETEIALRNLRQENREDRIAARNFGVDVVTQVTGFGERILDLSWAMEGLESVYDRLAEVGNGLLGAVMELADRVESGGIDRIVNLIRDNLGDTVIIGTAVVLAKKSLLGTALKLFAIFDIVRLALGVRLLRIIQLVHSVSVTHVQVPEKHTSPPSVPSIDKWERPRYPDVL